MLASSRCKQTNWTFLLCFQLEFHSRRYNCGVLDLFSALRWQSSFLFSSSNQDLQPTMSFLILKLYSTNGEVEMAPHSHNLPYWFCSGLVLAGTVLLLMVSYVGLYVKIKIKGTLKMVTIHLRIKWSYMWSSICFQTSCFNNAAYSTSFL